MGKIIERTTFLIFQNRPRKWGRTIDGGRPDAGRFPIPRDRRIVTATTFLVQKFNVVALPRHKSDLLRDAFITRGGRPTTRCAISAFFRNQHATRAQIVCRKPEFGGIVASDVKTIVACLRRSDPPAPTLTVVIGKVGWCLAASDRASHSRKCRITCGRR